MKIGRLLKYKPQIKYMAKVLLIYVSMYSFITFYIGLTAEGGAVYSQWLDVHLNFVAGLRSFLLNTSENILNSLGHDTYLSEYNLGIVGGSGIRLVYKCLGFELIFGFVALILAYRYQGKVTWLYLVLGVVLIQVLNIIRIFGLTVLFSHGNTRFFDFIDHHDLFNIVAIVALIAVYRIFLIKAKIH